MAGDDGGDSTRDYVRELDPAAEIAPTRGEAFDHFIVIDRLGEGGMGVVLSAYDPRLDRKVALKILRAGGAGHGQRLLREAQAMAKLSHPNVVTVFHVGIAKERVYLAMEYKPGRTLSAWLRERKRTRHEILTAFMAAGRGLAAAHRLGLVHRDFKPDNVLVDDDGHVRVTDFGLVASADAVAAPVSPPLSPELASPDGRLTRTGAVLGTPRYMAPEQHRGKPVSARADQYSFCVALYEALYGEHPFGTRDESAQLLVKRVLDGELRPTPPAPVPLWLRAVLLRGMRVDPDERYADMPTLLDALARDPAVRRRRAALWIGGAAAVALGVAGLVRGVTAGQSCASGAERLAGAWDAPARAAVQAAFAKTGSAAASEAFARTAAALDRYGAGWAAARDQACEAAPSSRLRDLRLACLERRRGELVALVGVLREADNDVLLRGVRAAQALSAVAACADDAALVGALPLPDDPGARARVEEVREEIAHAVALGRAGRYTEGLKLARPIPAEAEATGWAPVRAEALATLAEMLLSTGDYKGGETMYGQARSAAAAARDDALIAGIWVNILPAIGMRQERLADAWLLAPAAEDAVTRAGDPPALRVHLLDTEGKLEEMASHWDQAAGYYERALAIAEKQLPPDDPRLSNTLLGLGVVAYRRHNQPEARRYYERALEIDRRTIGEDHPSIAVLYSRLALVVQAEGKLEESQPLIERSIAIQEKSYGADHPEVAKGLNNLANVKLRLEKYDEALALYERAMAIDKKRLGEDHPGMAADYNNLAQAYTALGRFDEARGLLEHSIALKIKAYGPEFRELSDSLLTLGEIEGMQGEWAKALEHATRGHAIWVKSLGAEHPATVTAEIQLGTIHDNLGHPDVARPFFEHALAAREKDLGPQHPDTAYAQAMLAENLLLRGDGRAAEALAERALAVLEAPKTATTPGAAAEARFTLARALAARRGDPARATALAREALAELEAVGPMARHRVAAVRAWLKTR